MGLISSREGAKYHSHKKRKDSLEGSLGRVLFDRTGAPKNTSTRFPQNTSNVTIECAGKPKQLNCFCDQTFGALMSLFYWSDITLSVFPIDYALWELCDIWLLLLRTTPGVTLYWSNTGGTFLRLLLVVG